MPWQLIYTSAPRGLLSGQSGFCTVARSAELREALVQRLEQLSSYHYLSVADAANASRNPTVSAFRILDLRGTKYYVLTRIQPCGLDFTARTNHLAHHLIFQASELSQLPSPAAILRYWPGWLAAWKGEPRVMEDPSVESFNPATKSCLPAQTWMRVTGDAGRAAGLLESECIRGCNLVCPRGSENQLLEMFCETLQLLNLNGQYPLRPWRHPFTTFLQAEDNSADFQWRACQDGTPAYQQAVQRTSGLTPLRAVRVPNNSLVKIAREGLKPPSSQAASSSQASLSLRRRAPGQKADLELTDLDPQRKSIPRPERPAFLDLNLSINSSTLARIGIVAAVLLILWHFRPHKPTVAPESLPTVTSGQPPTAPLVPPAKTETTAAPSLSHNSPRESPTPLLDVSQLDAISTEGPTYLFTTPNLTGFDLPISSISRFQNLLQRFDHLEARPDDIQLSVNTDDWGFLTGTPLTVNSRQSEILSAKSDGLEFTFDYTNWKNNGNYPIAVRAAFAAPPAAFSIRFVPTNGDPFRLLIVNESNAPAPLRLNMDWLRPNCEGLVSSLQPPLGERLLGNFKLLGERRMQLRPFIKTKGAHQPRYLYQNWPAEDLPPLGDELDFAQLKSRLEARQAPLRERVVALAQKLEKQSQQAGFETPTGKNLGFSNPELVSFSSFSDQCSSDDFIEYVNHLKKRAQFPKWPLLFKDDDDSTLTDKFKAIYNCCIEQNPDSQAGLTFDNTNYFAAVWQHLKEIEKTRQDRQRTRNEIDKLRARRNLVPETLDKVAYVGLFIIDPPRPGLEMIRFQAP